MAVRLVKPLFGFVLVLLCGFGASANEGYKLWLQYAPIERHEDAHYYQSLLTDISVIGHSPTHEAIRREFQLAAEGFFRGSVSPRFHPDASGKVCIG
jgi:alpha-glucuronidase